MKNVCSIFLYGIVCLVVKHHLLGLKQVLLPACFTQLCVLLLSFIKAVFSLITIRYLVIQFNIEY